MSINAVNVTIDTPPRWLAAVCRMLAEAGAVRHVASVAPQPGPSGTAPYNHVPRLLVCLAGTRHVRHWQAGESREFVMYPGDALFLQPDAYIENPWLTENVVLALSFMPDCLRVAAGVSAHQADPLAPGTPGAPGIRNRHRPFVLVPGRRSGTVEHLAALFALLPPELLDDDGVLLVRLLLRQAADLLDAPSLPPGKADHTWQHLLAHLDERLAEPLDRASVGQALRIHPNHVSRLCRQFAGQSFVGVLTVRRLERAARRLRERRETIAEVAYACGFVQPSYFARQFALHYGMTPARWRTRESSRPPSA